MLGFLEKQEVWVFFFFFFFEKQTGTRKRERGSRESLGTLGSMILYCMYLELAN